MKLMMESELGIKLESLSDDDSIEILDYPAVDTGHGNITDNDGNDSDCFIVEQYQHSTTLSQAQIEIKKEDSGEVLNAEQVECNYFVEFCSPPEKLVVSHELSEAVSSLEEKGQDEHNKVETCTFKYHSDDKAKEANARLDNAVELTPSNTTRKTKTRTRPMKRYTSRTARKWISKNRREYIIRHATKASKIPQLGFSARLMFGSMELVIHNKGCLMVTDNNFVAKVKIVRSHLLLGMQEFQRAAGILLDLLRIDEVLSDEVTADRAKLREVFLTKLEHVVKQLTLDKGQISKRIEMLTFIQGLSHNTSLTYVDLCRKLTNEGFQCEAFHGPASLLTKLERKASRREKLFRRFGYCPKDLSANLQVRLNELVEHTVEHYGTSLQAAAPAYLHGVLSTMGLEHLMLISSSDVKVFTDMSSVLRADVFEKPLQDLAKRWIKRVRSINVDSLNEPLELTSVSIFYLCKSLEEVIVEIAERTDHQITDLLNSSDLGWYPVNKIVWKSENALTRCIQREYYFIFHLLQYFEVTANFGRQSFQYNMQLFNNSQSSCRNVLSGSKSNPFEVPDDFYVWYCLLDDVLYHVLPNGCKMDLFESAFEGYEQMVRDSKYDQMESLRVVTHNLARYIAQSYSYGGISALNSPFDNAVLRRQLDIFSYETIRTIDSSKNFRDQLNAFNSFWRTRNDIIDQLPTKIRLLEMFIIQQRLMDIMLMVLNKDIGVDTRVAFFRTYNDFLIDLNDVPFDWYIKLIPKVMESVIHLGKVELVDNKWKDTNNRAYRVLDPENFAAFISTLAENADVPKHYVIEIVRSLLDYIVFQLQRTDWVSGESLSVTDQVVSTTELICAMRNSLIYFKEQADYVSFELFYDERVKPFSSALESAISRHDFTNRVKFIKESFWYVRKQNETSFEDTLRLYNELNYSHDSQLLRQSYARYFDCFEKFMRLCVHNDYSERAAFIAEKVKALLSKSIQFMAWDARFKQCHVPQILAGLGAVWSILVSKDVASVGKYFSPHCIQILCILRLLSVDADEQGIDKHLAQVMSGQGKSLILGLLATLFALTGHKVYITCYSEYLAKRDRQDLLTFYEMFGVAENVTYGTFNDLANEVISPTLNGQKVCFRKLVSDLLFKGLLSFHPQTLVKPDSSNDILLLDEVDVFFTKQFYGTTYIPVVTPLIPGLDCIQEQIWKHVVADCVTVESSIHNFIQCGYFEKQKQFLEFLNRPGCYTLCDIGGKRKIYTNNLLFNEHLKLMIRSAKIVHSLPSTWVKFKLDSEGAIVYNFNGIYDNNTYVEYQNVFNYFRLKKQNFVTHVGEHKNCGYLKIDCGSLAYAMLPMNYSLIVGVSGTLTSLNQYEKDTIQRLYNIRRSSVIPTFFGCSNLKFDEISNFHHHATNSAWRTHIFSQVNQMIAANRAVIVFFETDVELDAFKAEHSGQLDRVNVLTENTDDKEMFANEAGVAKTITLATRGMGRGVDYKSSLTVEKNGGVHIIQTFFSMDVKEETQIKGRTARKDNKGSYELIVLDQDLRSNGLLVNQCRITYAELDATRSRISLNENKKLSVDIKKSMEAHWHTMNYMSTFFGF